MAYSYSQGPLTTRKTIRQIADVMRDVGESKRFMSLGRRINTGAIGASSFGSFSPSADDDPYETGPASDWQIGFGTELSVTNSMNMTLTQGYKVIFRVYDGGSSRKVTAKVTGAGMRGETEKLVRMVFSQLQ